MCELCEKVRGDLKIAGHSPSTTKIYLMYARQMARHHMRSPAEMGRDEIREFMLHYLGSSSTGPGPPGTQHRDPAPLRATP
jgi:hypothetical protein